MRLCAQGVAGAYSRRGCSLHGSQQTGGGVMIRGPLQEHSNICSTGRAYLLWLLPQSFSYESLCRLIRVRAIMIQSVPKSPSVSNLTVSTWLPGDSLDPIITEGETRFGWTTSGFNWTCPLVTLATITWGLKSAQPENKAPEVRVSVDPHARIQGGQWVCGLGS